MFINTNIPQQPCRTCGSCPTCGRSAAPVYPVTPYVQPWVYPPIPNWYTSITSGTTNQIVS